MHKENLIIIPAYNESENLDFCVEDVTKNAPSFDYLIVNDCSKDNSLELLKDRGYNHVSLSVNLGIGGAVQTGYKYAVYHGYKRAVQYDGDGQHDASYLESMLEYMISQDCDMVIGSRFIKKEGFQSSRLRRFGISYFRGLTRLLTGHTITDPTSGMRLCGERIVRIFADSYPTDYPEPESIISVLSDKYKIEEIPVKMRSRQHGTSSISLKKGAYYMLKVSIAMVLARMKRR